MWRKLVKFGLAGLALMALGCVGELELTNPPTGGPPPGADAGPAGGGPGETAFRQNVFPSMQNRQCITCHADSTCAAVGAGVCFLGGGDEATAYTSLKASTYLGTSPATSTIINLPPTHTGQEFCDGPGTAAGAVDASCTADQLTAVTAWVNTENGL